MKKKILVIDDDIMALRMLKKYLESDYEVQLENSGYRFAENVQDYHVDMILLDIDMPLMNGMEVLEAFLAGPHDDIPVVFLSGMTNPQIVREAIEKGAAGYIVKTASKIEILARIREVFREKSGQKNVTSTIILGSDISHINSVKIAMESAGYRARVALSIADAVKELNHDETNVLIFAEPFVYCSEQEAYDAVSSYFKGSKIPVVFCDEVFSRESILEKVGKAVGGQ